MIPEIHARENGKYTIFEASIIGFFVGVIVAAYLAFITSTGGFFGTLLNWISLQPLLAYFNIPDNEALIGSFLLAVIAYTFYGAVIGILIKIVKKTRTIIVPTIILLGAIITEQAFGATRQLAVVSAGSQDGFSQTAASTLSLKHTGQAKPTYEERYFGAATSTEATGDLNGDNKADTAFLIHRNDSDRGTLYYLSAAIATTTGHTGTDLLFLGDKIVPQTISINDEIIDITYSVGTATTTNDFYFNLVNGTIQKIASSSAATSTTSTGTPDNN